MEHEAGKHDADDEMIEDLAAPQETLGDVAGGDAGNAGNAGNAGMPETPEMRGTPGTRDGRRRVAGDLISVSSTAEAARVAQAAGSGSLMPAHPPGA